MFDSLLIFWQAISLKENKCFRSRWMDPPASSGWSEGSTGTTLHSLLRTHPCRLILYVANVWYTGSGCARILAASPLWSSPHGLLQTSQGNRTVSSPRPTCHFAHLSPPCSNALPSADSAATLLYGRSRCSCLFFATCFGLLHKLFLFAWAFASASRLIRPLSCQNTSIRH